MESVENKDRLHAVNPLIFEKSSRNIHARHKKRNRRVRLVRFILIMLIVVLWLLIYYLPIWRTSNTQLGIQDIQVTPDLIKRGAYLANHVAVCMDCHAERDWTRYSGPPVAGTQGAGGEVFNQQMGFPGTFYAKNITGGHLGKWTDQEILRAFTTGVKPDGAVLFPVMPYPYYRHLDPMDAAAIIAYLRTLPVSQKQIPERTVDFPVNILLRLMPKSAAFKKAPSTTDPVAYGGYLTMIAGCAECHTPANHGQIDPEQLFAGGRLFKMPGGDLYSPNITADSATGIGRWTAEQFIAAFKFYADSTHLGRLGPNDKNTIMPWSMYSGMDSTDLAAIYAYLRTVPVDRGGR